MHFRTMFQNQHVSWNYVAILAQRIVVHSTNIFEPEWPLVMRSLIKSNAVYALVRHMANIPLIQIYFYGCSGYNLFSR